MRITPLLRFPTRTLIVLALLLAARAPGAPATAPTPVVLAVDGITMVRNLPVLLAERLGYFQAEGLQVTLHETSAGPDIDAQLTDGRITGMVAYYHHTIVAQVEEHIPMVAVVTLGVTPGYKVLLAPRLAGTVKTPADLKGRRIISGGPHSAKTTSANWIILHAGLTLPDYQRLSTGDKKQIAAQLQSGEADLVVAPEPDASRYLKQGVAVPFLDLYSTAGTTQAVGSVFPTTVLYLSASYAEAHPALAQHLTNAFVRTLRFINTHQPEEIARLVPEMATGANRAPAVLQEGVKMFATNGLMSADAARAEATVVSAQFPQYAAADIGQTYTNRFVEAALIAAK